MIMSQMTTSKAAILTPFTGIAFPLRVGPLGKIETSTTGLYEIQHIIESVQQIVSTRTKPRGERYILRDFGGELPSVVFEPINTQGLQIIKSLVVRALAHWEPRVRVQHIEVTEVDAEFGRVTVEIDLYVIKMQKLVSVEVILGGTEI